MNPLSSASRFLACMPRLQTPVSAPAPPQLPPPVQGKYGKVSVLAEGFVGPPKVSADGKAVVWDQVIGNNSEIMKYQDGQISQLTQDNHASAYPAVSGDGSAVSFTRYSSTDPSDPKGNWDLYQVRDGVESPVSNTPGDEYFNGISRDGKVIVFDVDDGHSINIFKWENGQIDQVTKGFGVREAPIADADGKRIFWRDRTNGNSHIWMRDENGKVAQVTSDAGDQYKHCITPDGGTLVYTENAGQDEDVAMLKIGSGTPPTIVAGERNVDETFAALSADGGQIAWTSFDRRHGNPADVEIFLKDGDQTLQLTDHDKGLPTDPSLSEDGRVVSYLWVNPQDLNRSRIILIERDASVPPPSTPPSTPPSAR